MYVDIYALKYLGDYYIYITKQKNKTKKQNQNKQIGSVSSLCILHLNDKFRIKHVSVDIYALNLFIEHPGEH